MSVEGCRLRSAERGLVVDPAKAFVRRTFAVIESSDLCVLAATFVWPQDLLPQVFSSSWTGWPVAGTGWMTCAYYRRHISGEMSWPPATRLVNPLRATPLGSRHPISDATLEARRDLWDGVCASLKQLTANFVHRTLFFSIGGGSLSYLAFTRQSQQNLWPIRRR